MKPYGKARRLVTAIEEVAGADATREITSGLEEPPLEATQRRKAEWSRDIITRMEQALTPEQCREVLARRACRMPGNVIEQDRSLWAHSGSLEGFARMKRELGHTGFLCEGNTLRVQVAGERCHCLPVYGAKVPISQTYCHCCAGQVRATLEDVFAMPVEVEAAGTVIGGAGSCWFVAHIGGVGAAPPSPPAGLGSSATAVPPPFAPPDGPLPARIVELPSRLAVPAPEADGLEIVHRLLAAIATAAHATSRAEQDAMRRAMLGMLDVLWNMGLNGELVTGGAPCLRMENSEAKAKGHYMPDHCCADHLVRLRMPGVRTETAVTKRSYPKNWEIRLFMDGPGNGLHALMAPQRFVRALCEEFGQPAFRGSRRYVGEAYTRFRRADMRVVATR